MTRTLISYLSLLAVILLVSCNETKNKEILEEFEGEEGVYMIKLPPGLFLNMLNTNDEIDTEEIGNVEYVKLLMFDESNSNSLTSKEMIDDIKSKFDKYGYEMAIEFYSGGTGISAYMLQDDEYVSDLLVLISEKNSLIGLGLSGKLDGSSILEFASDLDYNDLKGLSSGSFSF